MSSQSITQLLRAWRAGDNSIERELLEQIYPEIHAVAARQLHRFPGVQTLQTTELVHEAYEKLRGQNFASLADRTHFYAITATVIRRILIDHLRGKSAEKRGGDLVLIPLDDVLSDEAEGSRGSGTHDIDWLELDQALNELAQIDRDCVRVVEMRVFSGLTIEEVSAVLEVSTATVSRQWRFAKAWLARRLGD